MDFLRHEKFDTFELVELFYTHLEGSSEAERTAREAIQVLSKEELESLLYGLFIALKEKGILALQKQCPKYRG